MEYIELKLPLHQSFEDDDDEEDDLLGLGSVDRWVKMPVSNIKMWSKGVLGGVDVWFVGDEISYFFEMSIDEFEYKLKNPIKLRNG